MAKTEKQPKEKKKKRRRKKNKPYHPTANIIFDNNREKDEVIRDYNFEINQLEELAARSKV